MCDAYISMVRMLLLLQASAVYSASIIVPDLQAPCCLHRCTAMLGCLDCLASQLPMVSALHRTFHRNYVPERNNHHRHTVAPDLIAILKSHTPVAASAIE